MARRTTSPRLVGRDRDLADLVAAVDSEDPERPLILVAGEAGMGKTRLIGEAIERLTSSRSTARPAWNVARGSCLRLADGELPFAPILEVLDGISTQGLSERAKVARGRLTGTDPSPSGSSDARTVRFVEIHDALIDAATDARLLVVIDDLHWADRSTLDLLLFLARRLRGGRVAVLGAYRNDELHRRHPLRPILAELSHGYVRARFELEPLVRDAVAEQIAELMPAIPPGLVQGIAARADGNPFYVEELVALGSGTASLPDSVRDVLLARVAALDPTTIRVLGACAVVGREARPALLAEITGLADATVADALRSATDHAIVVALPGENAYRFRHALLEEAVHDDLLPPDRVFLHRRAADALRVAAASGDDAVTPGELARHLDHGGEPGMAILAYLDAADLAFRALAWAEGVAAYERAAELAAGLGEHVEVESAKRLRDLTVPAAMAMNWSGASARAIALLRHASAEAERGADAAVSARLWSTLGRILNDAGDEAEARRASLRAAELYEPNEATALGVDLLLDLAANAWTVGRNRQALGYSERAVRGAEVIGDPRLHFHALVHRAEARIASGHVEDGLADVERARELQREHGWLDAFGYLATNVGVGLADTGYLDEALEVWHEGLRMSRELGTERSWDPWNLPGLAMYAFQTGRWAEADAPIAESRAFEAPGMPLFFNELIAAQLAAGRGDLVACDEALRRSAQGASGLGGEFDGFLGLGRIARAEAAGDPEAKLAEGEAALRALEGYDTFVLRSRIAVELAEASADLVAGLNPRRDRARIELARARAVEAATMAADLDEGRMIEGTASVPWTRANVALASAEASRANGADGPADWLPLADAFRALRMLPQVAYVLYRAAGAAFRAGDRAAGAVHLRDALAVAGQIGMTVLLGRIGELGRAARVDLAAPATGTKDEERRATADPWRLSAREREVLALLAQGRTNGEIGVALFISTKTASVHVTHILDKLGVASRTEAALLAKDAGLLQTRSRPPDLARVDAR